MNIWKLRFLIYLLLSPLGASACPKINGTYTVSSGAAKFTIQISSFANNRYTLGFATASSYPLGPVDNFVTDSQFDLTGDDKAHPGTVHQQTRVSAYNQNYDFVESTTTSCGPDYFEVVSKTKSGRIYDHKRYTLLPDGDLRVTNMNEFTKSAGTIDMDPMGKTYIAKQTPSPAPPANAVQEADQPTGAVNN